MSNGRGSYQDDNIRLQPGSPHLNIEEMRDVVAQCEFVEAVPYSFHVTESSGRIYLQATYVDKDIVTGQPETQYTRKWLLSTEMLKSEIVRTTPRN